VRCLHFRAHAPAGCGRVLQGSKVEHTAQGDIYADIPFVFAHSTAGIRPTGSRKRPADEPEVIIPDPLVGPGIVCTYTCGFTAQPPGTRGYAHPYRLIAPIVSLQMLADHGVKANELRKLIDSGFLQGLLYLPRSKRVAPDEPDGVDDEWKGHSAALLYRPTLVHQGLVDNRARLTRLTEPAQRILIAALIMMVSPNRFDPFDEQLQPPDLSDSWAPS